MAINARNCGKDGRKARPRRGLLVCLGLAALLPAAGVWAAEVVDVRIGAHPGFTRIVFELDSTAGYRVERGAPQAGVSEVVVTIDATSIPRELQSSKSLVSSLRMVPKGAGSVAHVRIVKDGLRLKQMILASPPRIVLDVLAPAVAEAKPSAVPAVPKAEPKAEPKKVAAAPARAVEKPAPPPAPAPAPAPAVVKPSPAPPVPKPAVVEADEADLEPQDESMAPPPSVPPAPIPTPPAPVTPPAATPPTAATPAAPSGIPSGAPMRPVPGAPPSAAEKSAKPMTPAQTEEGMGMGTLGGLLALVALAAVAVLVFLRRRAAAGEAAASEFEGAGGAGGENPFAGLGYEDSAQPVLAAAGARAEESEESPFAGLDEVETPAVEVDPGAQPARRTAIEIGSIPLTAVDAADVAGSMGRTAVTGDPAGSDEVTRMMREFERRLASLETRLDEVVDARERLERQVAAQTEELRVQRAAIARTQRAVRNLTRGDEDIATEPAPRDPERPRGGD